jgi:hypothetical protein
MAKQWKCARCGTKNLETTLTCSTCRMIRGAVVVKTSRDDATTWQPPNTPSTPAWPPARSEPVGTLPASMQTNAPVQTYWTPPGEGTQGRSRMRLLIPALFLAIGVVGAALAVISASPQAPAGVSPATELQALNVNVGDCLDIANITEEEVTGISARPCNREHEYEVIFTGTMDGVGYPSDDALGEYFDGHCVPAFEVYIGEAWESSPLDIFWLTPNREGWRQGDRSIQCLVHHPTVKRLTMSLKGIGRLRA